MSYEMNSQVANDASTSAPGAEHNVSSYGAPSGGGLPFNASQDFAAHSARRMSNAGAQTSAQGLLYGRLELDVLKARLRIVAQACVPAIYKRKSRDTELLQEMGIRVQDWHQLKRTKGMTPRHGGIQSASVAAPRMPSRGPRPSDTSAGAPSGGRASIPKLSRAVKSKSNGSGRTYTSKFRGVHQTFPTKRWEAQFRRSGKPTSLGCFDHEEEAARAYDKMMLWCELHNTAGVKGGITNFEAAEYEKDVPWLQSITQDELIESLRSEGRRQAAHRMLRQKREGATQHTTDDDGPSGSAVE
mmetsp:Transcript_5480/g.12128  ORF Transcript_5480/g.12128 Transcript_5480/m.12128 type:complete len:300 (+) Transcript_5480:108-1007(+)